MEDGLEVVAVCKKSRERYAVYYCTGRFAKGYCPARATIRASYLDDYVEEQVLDALRAEDGLLAQAVQATAQLTERSVRSRTPSTNSPSSCRPT